MWEVYWFSIYCGLRCLWKGEFLNGLKFLVYPVGYWRLLPNALIQEEFSKLLPRRVLDVGSPKLMSLRLATLGADVIATDLDDPSLHHRWMRTARAFGLDSYHAVFQDATSLPYPDASFDLVYSISVVEHIPDDRAAMREMLRVTRPAGKLIVEVPYRNQVETITRVTDSKGKPVEVPRFYERHYDDAMLIDHLAAPKMPSLTILGESLYFDPIINGDRHVPRLLRAMLWPLEPLVAFWNCGVNRKRPLSAYLVYER
jgi:SAM-dependent methyltransferase